MLSLRSRGDAEALLAEFRTYSNDLAAARAERDRLIAEHQRKLVIPDELQAEIAALELTLAEAELALRQWALTNRPAEFGESQSLDLAEGWLRFRKGKRKVSLIDGWSWPKVLESMKRSWKRYVRMTPEVNKEAILEATSTKPNGSTGLPHKPKLDPQKLKTIGLEIVQEESFSVELKPLVLSAP